MARQKRKQVQELTMQGVQLTPQARPLDTYTRPAEVQHGRPAAKSSLQQVAEALSSFSPALRQHLNKETLKAREDAAKAGVALGMQYNRQQLAEAVKAGALEPVENPWALKAIEQQWGSNSAGLYEAALRSDYEKSGLAGTDDPEALAKFFANSKQAFLEKNNPQNNPDFAAGFAQHVSYIENTMAKIHSTEVKNARKAKRFEVMGNQASVMLNHFRADSAFPAQLLASEMERFVSQHTADGAPVQDAIDTLKRSLLADIEQHGPDLRITEATKMLKTYGDARLGDGVQFKLAMEKAIEAYARKEYRDDEREAKKTERERIEEADGYLKGIKLGAGLNDPQNQKIITNIQSVYPRYVDIARRHAQQQSVRTDSATLLRMAQLYDEGNLTKHEVDALYKNGQIGTQEWQTYRDKFKQREIGYRSLAKLPAYSAGETAARIKVGALIETVIKERNITNPSFTSDMNVKTRNIIKKHGLGLLREYTEKIQANGELSELDHDHFQDELVKRVTNTMEKHLGITASKTIKEEKIAEKREEAKVDYQKLTNDLRDVVKPLAKRFKGSPIFDYLTKPVESFPDTTTRLGKPIIPSLADIGSSLPLKVEECEKGMEHLNNALKKAKTLYDRAPRFNPEDPNVNNREAALAETKWARTRKRITMQKAFLARWKIELERNGEASLNRLFVKEESYKSVDEILKMPKEEARKLRDGKFLFVLSAKQWDAVVKHNKPRLHEMFSHIGVPRVEHDQFLLELKVQMDAALLRLKDERKDFLEILSKTNQVRNIYATTKENEFVAGNASKHKTARTELWNATAEHPKMRDMLIRSGVFSKEELEKLQKNEKGAVEK